MFDLKIIIIIVAKANEIPDRPGKMNEKNKGLFSVHPAGIVLKTNPAEKAIIQRQVFMDKPHLFDIILASKARRVLYEANILMNTRFQRIY